MGPMWGPGGCDVALMTWEGGCLYVRVAGTFARRLRGLLGSVPADMDGGGLLLTRCSSIHTIGMRYALDVAFLDGDGRVMRVVTDLRPGRMRSVGGSSMVLERPSDGGPWPRVGQMVRFHPCDVHSEGSFH